MGPKQRRAKTPGRMLHRDSGSSGGRFQLVEGRLVSRRDFRYSERKHEAEGVGKACYEIFVKLW